MKTTLLRASIALALFATLAVPALGQFAGGGFSFTAGQIPGTTTNDSATAGNVGQYIEALQTAATNFPATGTYGDLGSLALTAGDWDVSIMMNASANGATAQLVGAGIGTASGTGSTGITPGVNYAAQTAPTSSANSSVAVPVYRISIASSTTYYCKVIANYTVGTPQYQGRCSARRVR